MVKNCKNLCIFIAWKWRYFFFLIAAMNSNWQVNNLVICKIMTEWCFRIIAICIQTPTSAEIFYRNNLTSGLEKLSKRCFFCFHSLLSFFSTSKMKQRKELVFSLVKIQINGSYYLIYFLRENFKNQKELFCGHKLVCHLKNINVL